MLANGENFQSICAIDASIGRASASGSASRPVGEKAQEFDVAPPKGWRGVCGATLPAAQRIRLRVEGAAGAPVVAVMGGISANRRVAASQEREGWWADIVGPGKAIDVRRFRVAAIDFVAGDGVTPLDLTPADEAGFFAYALSEAGIEKLDAFVGASFGGMVALAFARCFPERLSKLALVCAAHRPSPLAQGWRAVQQEALRFAIEAGRPEEGVKLARALAMATYRSNEEFSERFSCANGPDGGVGAYLRARGEAYARETTAARYLTLSSAIDRQFERPEQIATPALIVGFDTDQIVPVADLEDLAARYAGEAELCIYSSPYGHDAFLKETGAFAPVIADFLCKEAC